MAIAELPLVSVGIPTFNRRLGLEKAIGSVLTQSYPNIEIIISDNASTDDTEQFCQRLCNQYPQIRYFRSSVNQGATKNFKAALASAGGEFFMWLADDDWIDDDYIGTCVAELEIDATCVLVGGRTKFYEDGGFLEFGRSVSLLQRNKWHRALSYHLTVINNGIFYGVMRRSSASAGGLCNCIGSDVIFVGSLAHYGTVKSVDAVSIHRQKGGGSASFKRTADSLRLSRSHGDFPFLSMAIGQSREIFREGSAYSRDLYISRLLLAATLFVVVIAIRAPTSYVKVATRRILVILIGGGRFANLRRKWLDWGRSLKA